MTEVNITVKEDRMRISLNGHALYRSKDDIVCAGISTLTCTLAAMLENMESRKELTDLVIDMNDGFVVMDFVPKSEHCRVVMEMAEIGYMGIADAYPEHCRVSASNPNYVL